VHHRRHSLRRPGELHLSEEGRELARRLRTEVGPYDLVVTSSAVRAVETAQALADPPAATLDELREMPEEVARAIATVKVADFATLLDLVRTHPVVAHYAARQAELWRGLGRRVPDGGRVLIVSHGGIIEVGACGALGSAVETWGGPLAPLEGVALTMDADSWTGGSVLRLRPEPTGTR